MVVSSTISFSSCNCGVFSCVGSGGGGESASVTTDNDGEEDETAAGLLKFPPSTISSLPFVYLFADELFDMPVVCSEDGVNVSCIWDLSTATTAGGGGDINNECVKGRGLGDDAELVVSVALAAMKLGKFLISRLPLDDVDLSSVLPLYTCLLCCP